MIEVYEFNKSEFTELSDIVTFMKPSHMLDHGFVSVNENNNNYPNEFSGTLLSDSDNPRPILDTVRPLINTIEETFDLMCTLAVHYPEMGFIDWHDNHNLNLHNAICTYSELGDSFFEYKDQELTVHRIQDPQGWSVKQTHWGGDVPVPHRAVANCKRITLTFSSTSKENVDSFIAYLLQ